MPDENLQASLQKPLNDNFTHGETSQIKPEITIVPSSYDPERERVALVQFRGGVPQFLSELTSSPLGDWQVEMEDSDISFDCHFFGFTQPYSPDGKKPMPMVADVIAITGLDGHAYGSWQGRGNLRRMWLRDFLSKDLPRCRTMIYMYNSKLSSHGVDTILDYGRELTEEMKKSYETEQKMRLVLDQGSRRWKRTGDFITTVTAVSALLQLPDHVEYRVPLHADHLMEDSTRGMRRGIERRLTKYDSLPTMRLQWWRLGSDKTFMHINIPCIARGCLMG
ncbi:hypothetical protein ATEIFO6365_0010037300 [Aspergillus terreus]|uniref:Uncharacterized protein n=1 Tax=Aspergillus terreus TaxID=33178 RepID=A0A5M3Z9S7_ASPTE|nr:hypothetical protein ATETN484_0012035200 [Aspergillus terreus]GFF19600.1 hypothetical protein ATEIFO6365_0010037300 [Aspergillus terreus]